MTYHCLQDSLPSINCSKVKNIIKEDERGQAFLEFLDPLQVCSTMAPRGNSHVSTLQRSMWSVQILLGVAQDLPPSAGTSRCAVS